MFIDQQEAEVNQTKERQEVDLIHAIDVSRFSIGNAVISLVENIKAGNINPLDAYTRMKALEKFIEDSKDQIRLWVIDEAMKYPKGTFEYNGCELNIQETGTRYDYAGTGDPEYLRLKEAIKKREAFLKAVSKPETITDHETGEIVTINPPIKTSTTSVAVTIR